MSFFGLVVALVAIGATAYYILYIQPQKDPKLADKTKIKIQPEANDPSQKESQGNSKNKKAKGTAYEKKAAPKTTKKKASSHPRFVRRIGGHSGHIVAMSISANGEWMATSGSDGQLRVTKIEHKPGEIVALSTHVENTEDLGLFKDQLGCLTWSSEDNRTIVATMTHAKMIVFYRMRKKKVVDSNTKVPYELVELVKRRISIKSKVLNDEVTTCVIDQTHPSFCLVFTGCDANHANVFAWDGTTGQSVGPSATIADGSGQIRLSPDGRFVCGRMEGKSSQVRIFEVHKTKVKGEVEPVFDRISSKSVMTLLPKSGKVADVGFFDTGNDAVHNTQAVVACVNGCLQVWDLNVEYWLREDPKLVCSSNILEKEIAMIATASFDGGMVNRIAVATHDDALHLFTYTCSASTGDDDKKQNTFISWDFTVEDTHEDGIGDIQFCPLGKTIFTRGQRSKDIFSWKIN